MAQEKVAPAPAQEFKPYIPESTIIPEFTLRAVLLGMVFGVIFGAVTVYVGLRAGLTVSASIPIAVLSISLLRLLGKATILENNIVQTTGSAGESVAAGVIFTLAALIFLGFPRECSRSFLLARCGGWLGVRFMIPRRRQLIVKRHVYPGRLRGRPDRRRRAGPSPAGSGLGLGGVTRCSRTATPWACYARRPSTILLASGASLRAAITSEYLGVGYIIGPRRRGHLRRRRSPGW